MNKNFKLKPCPFCGCENIQMSSDGGCKDFCVFCTNCNAIVKVYEWGEESEKKAIKQWNRRVESELFNRCIKIFRRIIYYTKTGLDIPFSHPIVEEINDICEDLDNE